MKPGLKILNFFPSKNKRSSIVSAVIVSLSIGGSSGGSIEKTVGSNRIAKVNAIKTAFFTGYLSSNHNTNIGQQKKLK